MTDKTKRERVIQDWIEETDQAADALGEWRRKLKQWQTTGCDRGEFHAALFSLRSAGLEGWADQLPLDELAEAVITLDDLADERELEVVGGAADLPELRDDAKITAIFIGRRYTK